MSGDEAAGVVFPVSADGRRSTSALGRAVVADALRQVDPVGALDAEQETNWRAGYLVHFRRLVEAGLASKEAALSVARDGLARCTGGCASSARRCGDRARYAALGACAGVLTAVTVPGTGAAESELSLPYRGERLRGSACCAGWRRGHRGRHRAVMRGCGSDGRGASGVARPARPDGRGARGGRRSGPAARAAELGRPGDRG